MTTVGRWSPNKVRARVLDGTWVSPPEELGGMVLLTPTSVDITGGGSETATTLANGSVEFENCYSISLNGVFSADYDNYMIVWWVEGQSSPEVTRLRLRSSGSDNSTANSYVYQRLSALSTTVSASRTTTDFAFVGVHDAGGWGGYTLNLYGPYLAQPTAGRSVGVRPFSETGIDEAAFTHNQSTSYDGFTFFMGDTSDFFDVGLVSVYGLVGA